MAGDPGPGPAAVMLRHVALMRPAECAICSRIMYQRAWRADGHRGHYCGACAGRLKHREHET